MAELLAPAGSFKGAKKALDSGADALYAGVSSLSMRPRRAEFDRDQFSQIVALAHNYGKKIYPVINIFPKEADIQTFEQAIEEVYGLGVDAVVISDLWALKYIKANYPDLDAHISIQASVTNPQAARLFEENGASVIVVARSLKSFEEIKRIRQAVSVKLEVFIHGGLCFMFDGNCYMSSFYHQELGYDNDLGDYRLYGQNNTKGECHLVCKRNTDLKADSQALLNKGRLMRRDDQIGLKDLPAYIEMGINIFKIEGRAMPVDYVARATSLYRQAIDAYKQDPEKYSIENEWLPVIEELKQHRLDYEAQWNIR